MKIKAPGIYDVPEDDYHADRVLSRALGRSLSQSGAKTIVDSCPALFAWERDFGRESTPAYDFGHGAHKYILGKGADVARIDAADWRTSSAREQRDAAYAAGRIPLLAGQDDKARDLARTVLDHPSIGPLFCGGYAELSAYGIDPETGVTLRARFDYVRPDAIIDLKTAVDPNPASWPRSATNFGYPIQAWWYPYVLSLATGSPGLTPMYFVVVRKDPPHLISVYQPTRDVLAYGEEKAREAIAAYAECESSGVWPAWDSVIHDFNLPAWVR